MKKYLYFILINMVVTSFFIACTKSDDTEFICDNDDSSEVDEVYKKYFGNYSSNIEYLTYYYMKAIDNEDSLVGFMGLKNDKLWYACFDEDYNKIVEWVDSKAFDTTQTNNTGKIFKCERFIPTKFLKTNNGFILFFYCTTGNINIGNINPDYSSYLNFVSNGVLLSKRLYNTSNGIFIMKWYGDNIFVKDKCYSTDGNLQYSIPKDHSTPETFSYKGGAFPVSLEEAICISSNSILRINFKEGKNIWEIHISKIEKYLNITSLNNDSKYIKYVGNNGNIWQYEITISSIDAPMKTYTIKVNISSGQFVE